MKAEGVESATDRDTVPLPRIALPTKIGTFLVLLAIAGYFLRQAGDGLRAGLTFDDLMNMSRAVKQSPMALLRDNVLFFQFTDVFRPFGAILYKLHYANSGLDPFPLRVMMYLFLTANIFVTYFFVAHFTRRREAGIISAFFMSYHLAFGPLYYSSGFCYDICCYFFYLSALAWYIRIRQKGMYLKPGEMLVLCILFLCALNSKEMAVSLPVAVGLYEVLFHPPAGASVASLWLWVKRNGLAAAIMGVMSAGFIFGRVMNSQGLAHIGGYRMELDLAVYLEHIGSFLGSLLQGFHSRRGGLGVPTAAAVLATMTAIVVISRSRRLGFCLLFFCVGVLPVAFIPQRGLESVYIPISGVVMFFVVAAILFQDFLIAKMSHLISRRGRTGAQGPHPGRMFRWAAVAVLPALAIALVTVRGEERMLLEHWKPEYRLIGSIIAQQSVVRPAVTPQSRIIYLREAFPPLWEWAHVFIADLVYSEMSPEVHRLSKMDPAPSAAEITAKFDYIFTMNGARLVELDRDEAAVAAAVSSIRPVAD